MSEETEEDRMTFDGKYDELCGLIIRHLHAVGVLLIVIGGAKGHGMSVSVCDKELIPKLPEILDFMSQEIKAQNFRTQNRPCANGDPEPT